MTADSAGSDRRPPAIDTTVPHSARIWNYWLGGKDNYEVDRMAGDQFVQAFPEIAVSSAGWDASRSWRYQMPGMSRSVRAA